MEFSLCIIRDILITTADVLNNIWRKNLSITRALTYKSNVSSKSGKRVLLCVRVLCF